MAVDWLKITNSRLLHFRDRKLRYIELDISGWHYWAFYCPCSFDYNEIRDMYSIECVFYARQETLNFNENAIEDAFCVSGQWLKEINGLLYRLIHNHIVETC